jgi:molybdenum cofactor guanylyltransferase
MGADKANLEFHGQTLLQAVLSRLTPVIDPCDTVIVAAANQVLPTLPNGVTVVRDKTPHAGPLAALATGISALPAHAKFATVVGCDMPFVSSPLLKALVDQAEDFDAVVPAVDGRLQPLMAVYRRDLHELIAELLAAGKTSLHALLERARTKTVREDSLREFDPELLSFRGCNTPEDYEALCTMGLQPVVRSENLTG